MAKTNKTPRMSVNKLGEWLVSRAARQNMILYNQKFPPDFIVPYYREAEQAIAQYLASNMENVSALERTLQRLDQAPADSVRETRRLAGNIEAIETFMNLVDDIDLMGAAPSLGPHRADPLKIQNVDISVRPEVVLKREGKSGAPLIGGIKLHFPKTNPLDGDSSGYVSAVMQEHCKATVAGDAEPFGEMCFVIDIASETVYPGVKSTKRRMREVEEGCKQIAALWPTIQP